MPARDSNKSTSSFILHEEAMSYKQQLCELGEADFSKFPRAKKTNQENFQLRFGVSSTLEFGLWLFWPRIVYGQALICTIEKECFKAKEEGHPSGQCDTYPRATRQPSPDPTHRALPVYQAVVNFYTEKGSNNVWLNATKTPISEDTCDKNEKTEKTGYDFSMNKCSTMPNESVQFHLDGEMAVYSFFSKPKCQGIPQFIASMLNNQCTKAITIPIQGLAPTFYAPFYSFDYPHKRLVKRLKNPLRGIIKPRVRYDHCTKCCGVRT
eukprot:Nk52_evm13s283 gene=Nk52_evmTU13s283